ALDLEKVRLDLATVVEGKQELDRTNAGYVAAFQRAKLAVTTGDPEAVAAEIRESVVPGQVAAALDHWAWVTHALKRHATRAKDTQLIQKQEAQWQHLLQTARLADPGPWKDKVCDPSVWTDPAALNALVREVRRELLKTSERPHLSAAMLELLSSLLG